MTTLDLPIPVREASAQPQRRPRLAVRRHSLLFLGILALISVPIFVLGALLGRTYDVGASFELVDRAAGDDEFGLSTAVAQSAQADLRAALARVPYAGVSADAIQIDVKTLEPGRTRATLSASTEKRDATLALMKAAVDLYTRERTWRGEDAVSRTRDALASALLAANGAKKEADGAVEDVEARVGAQGGATAAARLEALEKSLADKTLSLTVTNDTISRTEKQRSHKRGAAPAPAPAAPAAAPGSPDQDPEVVQLRIQSRMIGEQINEQLTVMGRTALHPYVVELETKQGVLKEKLEAALKRAAAGKPPPEAARAAVMPDAGPTAADQAIELRLAELYAQRDALEAQVAALKVQAAAAKDEVAKLAPRQKDLAAARQKQKAAADAADAAAATIARFEKLYGTKDKPGAARTIEITEPALAGAGARPVWPTFPLIAGVALGAGLPLALLAVFLAEAARRGFAGPREFSAVVTDVPVLGTVGEIRSPAQRARRRLWRGVLRPVTAAGLAAVVVAAAVGCYVALGRESFSSEVAGRMNAVAADVGLRPGSI